MSLRTIMVAVAGLTLGLTGAVPASAQPGHSPGVVAHALPGDAVFPEGVATDPRSDRFYVGSNADGTIYRGRVGQAGPASVFLPGGVDGRTSVTGMKVHEGLLYVAGAATGQIFVYDLTTGTLVRRFDTGHRDGFLNDIAFDRSGAAYVTDSTVPVLWRIPATAVRSGLPVGTPEAFVDLTGTPAAYQPGLNLNGIVATDGGRTLVSVASNTGGLFAIDTLTGRVTELPVTGGPLTAGDGMLVAHGRLLVVRNQLGAIVSVKLHHGSAEVTGQFTSPALAFPTTVAVSHGRLLVANSQFDQRGGTPALPFTVADLPAHSAIR